MNEQYNNHLETNEIISSKEEQNENILDQLVNIISEVEVSNFSSLNLNEDQINKEIIEEDLVKVKPNPVVQSFHFWKTSSKISSTIFCHACKTSIKFGQGVSKCEKCQKKVHSHCVDFKGEQLQKNTEILICKPNHFNLIYNDSPSSTPLIVFINRKSGGQQGTKLFYEFCHLLGREQVFDLADGGPIKGLLTWKDIPNTRILVAGGDGSVGWVLAYMDKLNYSKLPPVAILPLGTGNDLARQINWGSGYSGEKLIPILKKIENSSVVQLDRWMVRIETEKETRNIVMNNYLSIGSDATIALGFHELRNQRPDLFKSRVGNKMWYFYFGVNSSVQKSININKVIEVTVDGQEKNFSKNDQAVVILNLTSYCAGQDIWGDSESENFLSPSFDDGLLEVAALKGAVQMGLIRIGMTKAKKISQAKDIIIAVKEKIPVQIDGEPWIQDPCVIRISPLNKANMLCGPK